MDDLIKKIKKNLPVYSYKKLSKNRVKLYIAGRPPFVVDKDELLGLIQTTDDDLASLGIASSVLTILKDNGFDSVKKIRDAQDNDLLALSGIGETTLKKIRSVIKK